MIKRNDYLNRIIRKQNNGLAKDITGCRRTGKSYLLFNIFYNYIPTFLTANSSSKSWSP